MIKNKENLFSYLVNLFPKFEERWASEDNYNVFEDGSYSTSGLCAEFSQFYIDEFKSIARPKSIDLFNTIEAVLSKSEPGNNFWELANSLKSCFLENISQTEAGELSKGFMGEATREFFDQWHVYP